MGGKAGFTPAPRLRLQAGESRKSKSLAPLADDLARRIELGGDDVVGKTFIGKKNDLGADHVAIGDVYFRAMDSSEARSSLDRCMSNGLFLGIEDQSPPLPA